MTTDLIAFAEGIVMGGLTQAKVGDSHFSTGAQSCAWILLVVFTVGRTGSFFEYCWECDDRLRSNFTTENGK